MVLCDDLVALDNSINFLKIYDRNRYYYGGAQEWFNSSTLRKIGCSIVTAANITAYLAIKYKNKLLFNYDDMSKRNFVNHMESISEFIIPDAEKGLTSITYFNEQLIEFAKDKGVFLNSYSVTTANNMESIKSFIKDALSRNLPIALLMLQNDVLKEFDYHWMTVTRLFENMDKTYLDFSTWGERRIFTLENFYNYSSYGALSYFDLIN